VSTRVGGTTTCTTSHVELQTTISRTHAGAETDADTDTHRHDTDSRRTRNLALVSKMAHALASSTLLFASLFFFCSLLNSAPNVVM
jgi:hypothetical protein